MKFSKALMALVVACAMGGGLELVAYAEGPGGSITSVASPLVKTGSRASLPSATNSRNGYLTSADHLAFSAQATASPTDPGLYYGGKIYSTGVVATYFSDDFSRANVTDINGTAIQVGGVNWQVHNIGAGSSATETVGVVSHVLQCTVNCSGPGGYGDPGIVIDTSRADAAVSVTLPTYPLLTMNLFGLRMLPATGSPLAYPSGFYVYNGASAGQNHICIGGFGGGAPGETCSAGFATSATPVTVTASLSGNTISVSLSGISAPTTTITSSYQNTATIHGAALQHSVSAPGYTNFAVTSPLVAKSLNYQGYHANGTDTDTITVGEHANSDTGGFQFASTTGAPFGVGTSQITSAVPVGTPPLVVTSTTKVANLNSATLDSHSWYFGSASITTPSGSFVAGCSNSSGVTVTGAVAGDACSLGLAAGYADTLITRCICTAADTCVVQWCSQVTVVIPAADTNTYKFAAMH